MKLYRIPLVWEEYGHIWIEAESEEEAIKKALGPDVPLPENHSYVDESVMVDDDCPIETREIGRTHEKTDDK